MDVITLLELARGIAAHDAAHRVELRPLASSCADAA